MIKDLTQRLVSELQQQFSQEAGGLSTQDLQKGLQAVLGRLNLVTREEFDAQTAVLLRTREKLEALEAQLRRLEEEAGRAK